MTKQTKYYVHHTGGTRVTGPYTQHEIRQLLAANEISLADSCCIEGEQLWKPLVSKFGAQPTNEKTGCGVWLKRSYLGIKLAIALFVGVAIFMGLTSSPREGTSAGKTVRAQASASSVDIQIKNVDPFEWPSVKVFLNEGPPFGYRYIHPYSVQSGETFTVPLREFTSGDDRFQPDKKRASKIMIAVPGYDVPVIGFK